MPIESSRSTLTMPNPGTKAAPAKFKGGFSEVKGFLKHYEKLCDYNNVASDTDKCESITQYMSRHVTEFIEGLASFRTPNWSKLKSDILKYYDADLDTKRYRRKDLISYVKTSRDKKTPNLTAWKKYVRRFIRIGGWLEQANKLTQEEYASYFWEGIYKKLRTKIESRLMSSEPDRDLSPAFPVDRVIATAEKLLRHDRFDADLLLSENHKAKKATKKVVNRKEVKARKPKSPKQAPKKVGDTTSLEPLDEMEGLIKKMNAISLEDPDYALLYYRATKMDPAIKDLVAAPIRKGDSTPRTDSKQNNLPGQRDNQICFGCGEKGHGLPICPQINKLITEGTLTRTHSGHISRPDGRSVRRMPEESIVEA
ncbi:hypothetical protein P692DRAFT_20735359, partial [Suillus brevipes Sb2]